MHGQRKALTKRWTEDWNFWVTGFGGIVAGDGAAESGSLWLAEVSVCFARLSDRVDEKLIHFEP